jgi:hypothetical protein
MSAPAPGHRPKPNEVWGPHYACTSSLFAFANQNQSPHRVAQEIPAPRFSASCSVRGTQLSLPQCQLQPSLPIKADLEGSHLHCNTQPARLIPSRPRPATALHCDGITLNSSVRCSQVVRSYVGGDWSRTILPKAIRLRPIRTRVVSFASIAV